jgi:hypothetical protein
VIAIDRPASTSRLHVPMVQRLSVLAYSGPRPRWQWADDGGSSWYCAADASGSAFSQWRSCGILAFDAGEQGSLCGIAEGRNDAQEHAEEALQEDLDLKP